MRKHLKYLVFFIIPFTLISCFNKDERLDPQLLPASYRPVQVLNTIYNYSNYIDVDSGKIVRVVPIIAWDLAFECSPSGWHIIINTGNYKQVAKTGSTAFANNFSALSGLSWAFDAPTGNLDSTAIGSWVNVSGNTKTYTNEVYLFGINNGNGTFTTQQKLVFTRVTDSTYNFIFSTPDGVNADSVTIRKDSSYRYVFFSFNSPHQTLLLEPQKNRWDLMMGTYETYDYDPTNKIWVPYFVRGVLSNKPYVSVLKVQDANFWEFGINDIAGKTFSNDQEAIGFDWKDLNSRDIISYRIVPNTYYIIRSKSGNYVKLLFMSYTNSAAVNGYPLFILGKLN
jgi:hypothetical protein